MLKTTLVLNCNQHLTEISLEHLGLHPTPSFLPHFLELVLPALQLLSWLSKPPVPNATFLAQFLVLLLYPTGNHTYLEE